MEKFKHFVAAHEFDNEATFVYDTKVKQLEDTDDDCIVFGPKLPVTVAVRRNLAKLVAYCLNKDLMVAFPLTVERIYSDYEPGGEQDTPFYALVKYYNTEADRDNARKYALKLVNQIKFLDDAVSVHNGESPVLVPIDTEIQTAGHYFREYLQDLVEAGGEDWKMFGESIGFGSLRIGDELQFDDLKEYFYANGMETWAGKDVADTFNENNEIQIEYLEDSVWRVTKV